MSRPPRRPAIKYQHEHLERHLRAQGRDKEVVDKLAAALDKALDDPAVEKRLGELGGIASAARRSAIPRPSTRL